MLEKVFLGLGQFLAGFVFLKAVASSRDSCCLDGEYEVIVILTVEIWCEAVETVKATVYEVVLLVVPHGIAERYGDDMPAVAFKFAYDCISEVDVVDGVV